MDNVVLHDCVKFMEEHCPDTVQFARETCGTPLNVIYALKSGCIMLNHGDCWHLDRPDPRIGLEGVISYGLSDVWRMIMDGEWSTDHDCIRFMEKHCPEIVQFARRKCGPLVNDTVRNGCAMLNHGKCSKLGLPDTRDGLERMVALGPHDVWWMIKDHWSVAKTTL